MSKKSEIRIKKITEIIRKSAQSNYSFRVEKSTENDEIDKLADAVNDILEKLNDETGKINMSGTGQSLLISKSNLLQSLIDSLEYGLTIQDREYNIIFQNEYMNRVFGPKKGKCYHAYEFKKNICEGCPVKMSFEDNLSHTTERKVLMPSGNTIIWENTATPIKDAGGNVIACLEVVRNITERKRTEAALKDSEAKYRTVVESSLAGVYIIQDGVFKFVNNRWYDIYGYTPEETIEKLGPMDLTPPEGKNKVEENFRRRLSGEINKIEYDKKGIRKDGKIIDIRIFGSVMEYNGRPAISGTVIDITEQMRAIDALRESENKMRGIIDNIGVGVALISPKMEILEMNRCMHEWFPGSDIKNHPLCYKIFNGPSRKSACEFCPAEKTLQDGRVHEATVPNRRGQKVHTYRLVTFPLLNDKNEISAVIELVEDITERILLETQLRQAQKMEAVGRLAGGVAHDFNNMLSVILGYTELSLDNIDPSHPVHANLKEIFSAATRSSNIVRQLLAFARRQTFAPKVLDLNKTVENMLKILKRMIGEDIDIAWIAYPELWPVKMDPVQIEQMLANLCVNARDAIAGVGKITIETGNIVFDEIYCRNHAGSQPGEYTMLAVSDNGSGMGKDVIDKIFEPFYSTKTEGKGTGLGLATVFGIVKQNNGFINVYSESGKGTTFKIYLPKYTGQITERTIESKAASLPASQGEKILVVEDEAMIRQICKVMLESYKYEVQTAATPEDAVKLVSDCPCGIQLLITDVILPGMNGKDLSNRLKEICPSLKCLYMSGYTSNVIAHRGMLDEGVNFIQKPFTIQSLLQKVREVLDQK
ncbi:MAG: PAS domain S-box protein [Spirochaetes bacterium]|nr:PAS domain S-box protein [Spirochaetota bacterium]